MKPSSVVLVSLILASDIFASASCWKGKEEVEINLVPSNIHVKCGTAEYTSKEIDKAAREACYRKLTKRKILGISWRSQPKAYKGNNLIIFDENPGSPFHISNQKFHHSTHVFQFEEHPFLMWPLKDKFRHLSAKCYAIIEWSPDRVRCKAIAVILRERDRDDVKCEQFTIRDSTSRHAASSIYHPKSPSIHYREGQTPLDVGRPSSVHGTTRVPPFNSNLHAKEPSQAPSFDLYPPSNEITELRA